MTSLKILSVAAAVAVAIPAFATASFAQNTKIIGAGPGGGAQTLGTIRGGGGGRSFGGGGGWHGGGGGGWNHGGGWRGGGYRGGGFGPGFAAGAIIGSGVAASSYYGNSYGYYGGGSPYYGNSYYDEAPDVVEAAPDNDGDVDYCIRTYKSYNVRTGTYLGYDGLRHSCP